MYILPQLIIKKKQINIKTKQETLDKSKQNNPKGKLKSDGEKKTEVQVFF